MRVLYGRTKHFEENTLRHPAVVAFLYGVLILAAGQSGRSLSYTAETGGPFHVSACNWWVVTYFAQRRPFVLGHIRLCNGSSRTSLEERELRFVRLTTTFRRKFNIDVPLGKCFSMEISVGHKTHFIVWCANGDFLCPLTSDPPANGWFRGRYHNHTVPWEVTGVEHVLMTSASLGSVSLSKHRLEVGTINPCPRHCYVRHNMKKRCYVHERRLGGA